MSFFAWFVAGVFGHERRELTAATVFDASSVTVTAVAVTAHGRRPTTRHVSRAAGGHGAGAAAVRGHRLRRRTECGHTARPVTERKEPAAKRVAAVDQATADGRTARQRAGQRHRQPAVADRRVATTVGRQLHRRHAPQPRRGRRWPVRPGEWRFFYFLIGTATAIKGGGCCAKKQNKIVLVMTNR